MEVHFECLYCGFRWMKQVYYQVKPGSVSCDKCGDKNVKIKYQDEKPDYYGKGNSDGQG